MAKELNLDGGEISLLKAIGLSAGSVSGSEIVERLPEFSSGEIVESLKGLIQLGYVVCDTNALKPEEFKKASFQINSGYMRDLKEAMDPTQDRPKSRRIRRE